MNIRRWVLAPRVIALFILAVVAFVPVLAQQQGQKVDKKVEKAQQFDVQAVVSAANAALGIGISALIGLIAGTIPAVMASRLRIVDALRRVA